MNNNMERPLNSLHENYIKGTQKEALVINKTVFLCNLTRSVNKACSLEAHRVFVTTRMLKHLYDKKTAEEYEFIINNLHTVVKYPDDIYKNRNSKRGDFLFAKLLKSNKYLCSIEICKDEEIKLFIATCFRIHNPKYLDNYEFLWSWKVGKPSS